MRLWGDNPLHVASPSKLRGDEGTRGTWQPLSNLSFHDLENVAFINTYLQTTFPAMHLSFPPYLHARLLPVYSDMALALVIAIHSSSLPFHCYLHAPGDCVLNVLWSQLSITIQVFSGIEGYPESMLWGIISTAFNIGTAQISRGTEEVPWFNALGSFHTFEQWCSSVSRSIEGYPGFVVIDSILKEKHENLIICGLLSHLHTFQ